MVFNCDITYIHYITMDQNYHFINAVMVSLCDVILLSDITIDHYDYVIIVSPRPAFHHIQARLN